MQNPADESRPNHSCIALLPPGTIVRHHSISSHPIHVDGPHFRQSLYLPLYPATQVSLPFARLIRGDELRKMLACQSNYHISPSHRRERAGGEGWVGEREGRSNNMPPKSDATAIVATFCTYQFNQPLNTKYNNVFVYAHPCV